METSFLFPGQGSQIPNLLDDLPHENIIKQTVDEASEILGYDIRLLQSKKKLESTKNVQICLLVSGVAVYRYFLDTAHIPTFVAGHSVGAFGAAVASEVLSFEDALNTVALRGQLMEQIHPEGYGMIVVLGMDHRQLQKIIDRNYTNENPVYLANINSQTQITVSGSREGLEKVIEDARENGANCANFLSVNTPSHSPLLSTVSEQLKKEMKGVTISDPKIKYVSNYNARVLYDGHDVIKDLYLSIASSVQWDDVTSILYENGVRYFQEMPPNNVLTKLINNKYSDIRALAVSETNLDDCKYVLEKMK